MNDLDRLERLRQLPHTWIQLICNSRVGDDLAWSLTCKYGVRHDKVVQHVSVSLTEVLDRLEATLKADGLLTNRKLKLKRSNPS